MADKASRGHRDPLPPYFALAASRYLYDADLPDSLYRTYARIVGLSWRAVEGSTDHYVRTPPLTIYDLSAVCGLSVRHLWRQVNELVRRGLLVCESEMLGQKHMVFYPVWPGTPCPSTSAATLSEPAEPSEPAASAEPAAPARPTAPTRPAVGAQPTSQRSAENLQALAACGVSVTGLAARHVAALPHVTPERIRACASDLHSRGHVRNLPGLLLHILKHDAPLSPEGPSKPGLSPSPTAAPAGLPPDLHQALDNLGWAGDDAWAEARALAARDLAFVWAWVRYIQARPALGAAFLRSRLRGAAWPPGSADDRRRAERVDRWRRTLEDEPHLPRAHRPHEQAAARRGLPPELATLWQAVLTDLALQMPRATFDHLLRGSLLLSLDEKRATLGVRSPYAVDWVEHRMAPIVLRALGYRLGRPVETVRAEPLAGAQSVPALLLAPAPLPAGP